jgi:hypothetical protein
VEQISELHAPQFPKIKIGTNTQQNKLKQFLADPRHAS